MGEAHPRTRRNGRVLACLLTGGVRFCIGALLGPLPSAYGQRGAELGTVLLENDKVVVRRFFLLPGLPTGMHSHEREYLRIILQGGTIKVTTPTGRSQTEQLEAGSLAWRSKTRHDSENVGSSPVEALLIEIK
jgi:quercetin dioxygenase-like cupin family protein